MTKLLGVIGSPIAHSLSPLIHNGWLREAGIDARYMAMQVPQGEFQTALETLAEKNAIGVNVTLPHKLSALECAAVKSKPAEIIGAANTLTLGQDGCWRADNTDAVGFEKSLTHAGHTLKPGQKVLVIGAGGAARAVVHALDSADCSIRLANRTEEKARDLLSSYKESDHHALPLPDLPEAFEWAELVINTASLGHSGEQLSLPVGGGRLFNDISYGKAAAGQLETAKAAGWQTLDGLPMLVGQAARSFQIWFNLDPDFDSALSRCRAVVAATT